MAASAVVGCPLPLRRCPPSAGSPWAGRAAGEGSRRRRVPRFPRGLRRGWVPPDPRPWRHLPRSGTVSGLESGPGPGLGLGRLPPRSAPGGADTDGGAFGGGGLGLFTGGASIFGGFGGGDVGGGLWSGTAAATEDERLRYPAGASPGGSRCGGGRVGRFRIDKRRQLRLLSKRRAGGGTRKRTRDVSSMTETRYVRADRDDARRGNREMGEGSTDDASDTHPRTKSRITHTLKNDFRRCHTHAGVLSRNLRLCDGTLTAVRGRRRHDMRPCVLKGRTTRRERVVARDVELRHARRGVRRDIGRWDRGGACGRGGRGCGGDLRGGGGT